ncbi:hypothetical protein [Kribbella sp. NPDC006257]|uniref:hypothetical protein n=1 Tax=Kribbella sp. NPDC006257 TaxID=3156738 RepID=UPI0033BEF01B
MSTPQDPGFAGVSDLPPYRAMLVVDMKDYSGAPGRHHAHLNALIPEILQSTFVRCGLSTFWSETTFADSTGDGFAIGLPAERLPFLLNPFLEGLQNELEERGRTLTAAGFEPIRMRVSVAVGPVTDSGEGAVSDGAGNARVELHRLLDSKPVRDLLTRSGASTKVAAIVSARAYEDAVLTGYTDEVSGRGDEPHELYVEAPVQVKRYQGKAYLRVPKPSGELLTHGFRKPEDSIAAADFAGERSAKQPSSPERPPAQVQDHSTNRRGGVGNIVGSVGSIVTDPAGPTHTGTGHLYVNGPTDREPR